MSDRLVPFPISWRKAIVDSDLSSTVRHVALTLSMYMSELGDSAHPGATRLARDTGRHVSTVRDALAELVDGGWLALVEQGGRKGDRRRANTYAATLPTYPLPLASDDPSESATHRQDRARPVVQDDPISSRNSPTEPPNPPQAGGDHDHQSSDERRSTLNRVLIDVTHHTPATNSEKRSRTMALADLDALGATPDELRARAAQWHALHPDPLGGPRRWPTARQLVKHWHVLVPPPPEAPERDLAAECPDCVNGWVLPDDSDVAVQCDHPTLTAAAR